MLTSIYRMSSTAGQVKCDSKLEIAILQYFKSFRKVYMMDSANGPSMGMTVPGGTYVLHRAVHYSTLLYPTLLFSTVLYSTQLYCTLLY